MKTADDEYQLRGYLVSPRSVDSIRDISERVREVLGVTGAPPDLEHFLEDLTIYGITVDVVEAESATLFSFGAEAVCVPETATIYLSEVTYNKACANDPRTRFTIYHELGHFVLDHKKMLNRANVRGKIKAYMDSEWQADQFAAEFSMPLPIIHSERLCSPVNIRDRFGVSLPAAERRYKQLLKRGDIN